MDDIHKEPPPRRPVPALRDPSIDAIAEDLRETYLGEYAAGHGTWRVQTEVEKDHWRGVARRAVQLIAPTNRAD